MALDHDGDTASIPGKPYKLRNIGGVIDCSCPAWRNQSKPIDQRTCKHIIAVRGVEVERARVGNENMPTKFKNAINPNMSPAAAAAVQAIPPGTPPVQTVQQMVSAVQLQNIINEKANPLGVLLAKKYEWDWDPKGYLMSEKLDGVRAYWDGENFLTRNGNVLYAPDWFKAGMPKDARDGELWIGRHRFQETISIVRRQDAGDGWKQVKYRMFDAPDFEGRFEDRLKYCESEPIPAHCSVVEHIVCEGKDHLERYVHEIIKLDGEGAMLRKPGSHYVRSRSDTLWKVKRFRDSEAVVIAHTAGKGKYKGMLGALICRWIKNGAEFNVGSGLSDAERLEPPPVGSTITFRYTETTKAGKPKCGSFVCVRDYE